MIKAILRNNVNKWQVFGAALGAIVGLFLLVLSLQFYADIQSIVNGDNSDGDDFVIINKKVSIFNTLGGTAAFNEDDLQKIKAQPFISDVGYFTSNRFRLLASSPNLGFRTELFFESLPDEYVDVKTRKFKWKVGDDEVPMVMSKDYLALYNFGFAPSAGLPQFTSGTINKIQFNLTMVGDNRVKTMKGRIVGFSDRINSIIVPQSFMDWANTTVGSGNAEPPARLLLDTDNPYSEELRTFLADNNFEISSGKVIGGEVATLLNIVVSAIGGLGILLVLLSLLVFVLSFQLVIARSSNDIRLLLQLGHRYQSVSKVLTQQFVLLFSGIVLTAAILLGIIRYFLVDWFVGQGFELTTGFTGWVLLVGAALVGVFMLVNLWNIRRHVVALA